MNHCGLQFLRFNVFFPFLAGSPVIDLFLSFNLMTPALLMEKWVDTPFGAFWTDGA